MLLCLHATSRRTDLLLLLFVCLFEIGDMLLISPGVNHALPLGHTRIIYIYIYIYGSYHQCPDDATRQRKPFGHFAVKGRPIGHGIETLAFADAINIIFLSYFFSPSNYRKA